MKLPKGLNSILGPNIGSFLAFPFIPFFLPFIVTGILASPYRFLPVREYFGNTNPEFAVKESLFFKKIAFVVLLFIILIIIIGIVLSLRTNANAEASDRIMELPIDIVFGYFSPVFFSIFTFIRVFRKKEFNYHLAKACFITAAEQKARPVMVNYMIRGLKAYDDYIRKTSKLTMALPGKIITKAIFDFDKDNHTLKSIIQSFSSDDSIQPLLTLDSLAEGNLLKYDPLINKVKEWGIIVATILGLIVALIQFIVSRF